MGKFLKFKIANGETVASGNGSREVLIPVDQIASIEDGADAVIYQQSYRLQHQQLEATCLRRLSTEH